MNKQPHRLKIFMLSLLQNERRRLKHFSLSALVFFIAYGMLYSTQKTMPPSLQQELTALAYTGVAGLAFSWAITLHILSIIAKVSKK